MTLEETVSKYIRKTERVFGEVRRVSSSVYLNEGKIESVIETAKRYLEDVTHRMRARIRVFCFVLSLRSDIRIQIFFCV